MGNILFMRKIRDQIDCTPVAKVRKNTRCLQREKAHYSHFFFFIFLCFLFIFGNFHEFKICGQ